MNICKRIEPRVSGRGVNRFVAVDELNAKYVAMRDVLKKQAAADMLAEEQAPGADTDTVLVSNGNGHGHGNGHGNGRTGANGESAAAGKSGTARV